MAKRQAEEGIDDGPAGLEGRDRRQLQSRVWSLSELDTSKVKRSLQESAVKINVYMLSTPAGLGGS